MTVFPWCVSVSGRRLPATPTSPSEHTLRVLAVFDSLQGEGVWTGTPMTFIRLAGCNAPAQGFDCVRWCDTPESWDGAKGTDRAVGDLAESVRLPRVCVTGGEPLMQGRPLEVLVSRLHDRDVRVHLETNGSMALPQGTAFDWVTVSPKPPSYSIDPAFHDRIDELKLVVDEGFHESRAERLGREHPGAVLCLQPEASGGQAAVERAAGMVLAHGDWRLSLQLHKIVGME